MNDIALIYTDLCLKQVSEKPNLSCNVTRRPVLNSALASSRDRPEIWLHIRHSVPQRTLARGRVACMCCSRNAFARINTLRTKRKTFYSKSQFAPRSKHLPLQL